MYTRCYIGFALRMDGEDVSFKAQFTRLLLFFFMRCKYTPKRRFILLNASI